MGAARRRALTLLAGCLALAVWALAPGPAGAQEEPPPPPDTAIATFPPNPSPHTFASFTYDAIPAEEPVSFECALDWPGELEPAELSPCEPEGISYPGPLADGLHRFAVRAIGEGGPDPTPATYTWQIDTTAPQTSITATPPDPSDGFAASFAYSSSEPFSSFRCQLDDGAIQVCGSNASQASKTYFDLTDGSHAFRVWATDNAGNKDPTPATHSFEVKTSLGDSSPPDTQILLAPTDPSGSADAFFAYGSTEPGSSFECELDGSGFAPCPEQGKGYGPLANGPHTFAVRAIDRAGNTDSVPATHAWRVAAAVPNTRITKAPGVVRSKRARPVRVAFAFQADKPGTTYRCRVDLTGPYRPCSSPHSFKAKPGRHVFEVFAIDSLGNEEGSPAFRIFRVRAPGRQRSFFTQRGKLLSSLSARIAPSRLPRSGLRPVSLSFGSTFERLDGSDVPGLSSMTLKLARGGVLNARGLPRCNRARLAQRSTAKALAACRAALVGKGTVETALRFPEGRRSRSTARLLIFNARGGLLMHVYATEPVEGTFIVPLRVSKAKGRFGTVLHAKFPKIAAGFGQVSGFQMTLKRSFRHKGKRRSYLLAGCPAPRGLNRVAFELARVTYRFRGAPAIRNSTINSCRAVGR